MNLLLRVGSALVLFPLVVWLFFLGGHPARVLLIVVAAICLHEYGTIVSPNDTWARRALLVIGTLVMAAGTFVTSAVPALLLAQATPILFAAVYTLRPGDMPTSWSRMATLAFGAVYIGLPLDAVFFLRELGNGYEGVAAASYLLLALMAPWSNDTFAYFAGRAFGRHKMYEKISPKKTWEGFVGGALGTIATLLAMCWVFGDGLGFTKAFSHFTVQDMLLISIPVAVLGPLGDLAESMLKRAYGVKDSGKILPGHGGLLDRIDAVLFVAPWVLCYVSAVKPLLAP